MPKGAETAPGDPRPRAPGGDDGGPGGARRSGGSPRISGSPKSGLFAHFRGKEELLLQVLETARARFIEQVVKPGLAAPRGEPRLRALFESWLAWERSSALPGGCPFIVAAAVELDDRPGSGARRSSCRPRRTGST